MPRQHPVVEDMKAHALCLSRGSVATVIPLMAEEVNRPWTLSAKADSIGSACSDDAGYQRFEVLRPIEG